MSDENRFEHLVLPHLDAGYNLARWLAGDAHDAEDVLQEACMRALKYVAALHGRDGKAWFLTIVRHAFYDWCRRNRRGDVAIEDAPTLGAGAAPECFEPEHAAARSSQSKLLARALAELPLAYREVLILRELEDFSYKEIARITGVPIGTVMSRLARARRWLQRSGLVQAAQ